MSTSSTTQFVSAITLPSAELSPWVQCYIHTKLEGNTENFFVDLFPVGYCVISFTLDDGSLIHIDGQTVKEKNNLTGQLLHHYRMQVNNITALVYVMFTPLGAYRLLHHNQYLLQGKFSSLDSLNLEGYNECAKQLERHQNNIPTFIETVDNWLLLLLRAPFAEKRFQQVKEVTEYIQNTTEKLVLTAIYKHFNTSKSSLERNFKEVLGYTPKEYLNHVRFNRAYELVKSGQFRNWSEIVFDNHYFDQAHFIKEFKKKFGYSPNQVFKSSLNIAQHVKEEIPKIRKS